MFKKILFIIASEGFQPIEYGDAKKVLEAAGHQVVAVSDMAGKAIAKDGSAVEVDLIVSELNARRDLSPALSSAEEREHNYDGLFFIGGPGALEHLDNEDSYKLLREWQKTGKPYGAICISPRILAKAGVLQNKKATGWDSDGELARIFADNGVEYVRQPVVVDGNVVTGNGPSAAREWGEKIISN
ncbi:MAG: DJ-1/PfpI family protein [Candidatus Magasanikbacteria bacterium]|nr:DJ-1/PfpI family protein [Candidatus Magasanikbacteria bacterium]